MLASCQEGVIAVSEPGFHAENTASVQTLFIPGQSLSDFVTAGAIITMLLLIFMMNLVFYKVP